MAKKVGQVFYILFCGVPLTALVLYGLYLFYYHDYGPLVSPEFHAKDGSPKPPPRNPTVPQPPPPQQPRQLKLLGTVRLEPPALSAERAAGRQEPVTAEFSIANEGAMGAQVIYTPWPSALLDIRLQYLGPDGKGKPERLRPVKGFAAPVFPNNPMGPRILRHFTTVIQPGERLAFPIPLVPPYELTQPGVYRLEVLYDPLSYCTQARLNIAAINAYGMPLQTPPIEFTVGEVAVPAAPEKPAEEKAPSPQTP
ncbi:MAG: hypothetical protein KIS92_08820 [Planctomycetota bacterium]|nr:hypothetical protein [Planctomycetota bacterium]